MFKISVRVYLDYIFRTAEPFVIKLGMVVHIICWSVMQNNWVAVQGQDHNEGLFNQNITSLSCRHLIHWLPNFVWWCIVICLVKKIAFVA